MDTGGQCHQLCYSQDIQISNTFRLYDSVTLLMWYGIARVQTDWNDMKDEDSIQAAESLAKIVKHFLDAVPKLLEGLALD